MTDRTTEPSPIGTIVAYGGDLSSDIHVAEIMAQGWIPCDGQMLAITEYPDLYDLVLNSYGGDDVHFSLPDLRGRFVAGLDKRSTSRIGDVQADTTALPIGGHDFASNEGGDHSHGYPRLPTDYETKDTVAGNDLAAWNSSTVPTTESSAHSHRVDRGGDKESRPINVYTYFIIKAKQIAEDPE